MDRRLDQARGRITFVAGISDAARTPEGRLRTFPGPALTNALNDVGVQTKLIVVMTKYVETSDWEVRGYGRSRGVPLSPHFLVDLIRDDSTYLVCREFGVETLLAAMVARLRRRRAVVFQEHAGRAGAPLSGLDLRYRRLIGRLAHGFIANTPAAADEIVGALRVPRELVFQIMMLIPPDRDDLRSEPIEVPAAASRPVFLFVGDLILRKNVETLLAAAHELRSEGLSFEVWLGGSGPEETSLRAIADELGLDSTVRFCGPIPHPSIGFLYEACNVFVMPSYADVLSVALLEATRFGKAIICSAGVGAGGVVARENVNALGFDPGDPSDLARCMRRFIVEPHLAAEMGAQSHDIMAQHTPASAAREIVAALESMR